ncbi:murein L,D-transpeptidase catalytic domain family protein [Sandaracinobacter sp. RS1-74]|uniref:murein L,D-transpeptidase catalytic domain family protein n=1 Tax=Sandaracinobacteroides sayramensis TaxID=2913411 RepID=UPI001EDB806C|nr:murein L,D-transpeptidase catalytic domain family protein [Sandaracinobacteroides sayramensis]MCG2841882.1 murein L,D-transpeptidase catalytic domain family protein [Sandaracinobacteroides sayramensis]
MAIVERMNGRSFSMPRISRRALVGAAAAALAAPAFARGRTLAEVAREGLARHASSVRQTDVVGIADFARPSGRPRFWLVDLANGRATSHLVSHGRGSDPSHSGWAERFSNEHGSNASSMGGYLTGAYYSGKHGRSQRLLGLDPENSNAEPRAIVIHGAWYVSDAMVRQHGKTGRSEGCFAFDETNGSLDEVLSRLGPGRLLYAGRFGITA